MATVSRMVSNRSSKVQARQSAAERVKAALAAKVAALTSGVEAGMDAYARHQAALAEAEKADDDLRAAVEVLVQADQRLDEIAALLDVPVDVVRGCRRPKGSVDVDEPVAAPEPARQRRGRQLAVDPPAERPEVPAFLGEGRQVGDGDAGHQDGEQPPGDPGGDLAAAG